LIPAPEITRLKASVDLPALVRSRGIALKPAGKDLMGLCPFHPEKSASFSVTPSTNLWHCFGCGAGGDALEFIMQYDKLDFPEAFRRLSGMPHNGSASRPPGRQNGHAEPEAAALTTPAHQSLLRGVLLRYTENLKLSREAQEYLRSRGLFSPLLLENGAGFADGRLPATPELESLGIHRRSADGALVERFTGCIVFPATENGNISQIYGRSMSGSAHMLLPAPLRGFFREEALSYPEIILCECAIDTFSLLVHGHPNTCGVFGANGFSERHADILKERRVKSVYLAFDADPAGNRGAAAAAELLRSRGIVPYRIQFPQNSDANDFIQQNENPHQAFQTLIEEARIMKDQASPLSSEPGESKSEKQARPARKKTRREKVQEDAELRIDQGVAEFVRKDRVYRIYNLGRATAGSMQVSVSLSHNGQFFMDKLELCSAKERDRLTDRFAAHISIDREIIESDVTQLLYTLIKHKEQEAKEDLKPKEEAYVMTEEERREAMEFLTSPDLIGRIARDFEATGIAGESNNLVCAYLAGTSRLLTQPVHVLFHSSSAAGKSTLMNAVLTFMPDEVVIQYSAITGQVLFYMQSKDMKHKILAIAEDEGAARARYILKMLQTEGKASIASTVKDPETGRMIGEEFRIDGPLAVFSTSTALYIDEELLNRNLVLGADESIEQTRRIFQAQRERQSEDSFDLAEERERIRRIHKNAQRLLKPVDVINPFARHLKFPEGRSRLRRDHEKYLALIQTITLLHQFQRETKTKVTRGGKSCPYIEVTREDLEAAKRVAWPVFARTLDEMPPHTRTFLERITALRDAESERLKIDKAAVRLTRRSMIQATGLSSAQVHHHLSKLIELEYVLYSSAGAGRLQTYEILWDGTLESFFEGADRP
jgi:DNA primase